MWRTYIIATNTHNTKKRRPMAQIPYPSPRVSQLDAHILDSELFSLLKQQLSDAFLLHASKPWSYSQHPDLWALILKLAVFRLTTFKTGSSYGLKLQNLKLTNLKTGGIVGNKTRALLLAAIIGEYLFKKLESYIYAIEDSAHRGGKSLVGRLKTILIKNRTEILSKTNDTLKLLNLANFLLFLVQGRYPSVLHRVLGISMTPIIADLLKFNGDNVNFEFQNRQLVWNVMTEFLVFTLPLLQLRKWSRMAKSVIPYRKSTNAYLTTSETPIQTPFTQLPISQCAICKEVVEITGIKAASTYVTNACITNCGHIYCYVCISTRFNAIENGSEGAEGCPRCRMKLTSFELYGNKVEDIDTDAIMVQYEEVDSESEDEESADTTEKGNEVLFERSDDSASDDESHENEDVYDDMEDLEEEMDEDDFDDEFEEDEMDEFYD